MTSRCAAWRVTSPSEGEPGFRALTGEGQIIVTVEATDRASSYQGVVPITGNSLAESLEAYFDQSEQLPTRVVLATTPGVVAGMLVQRIPGEGGKQAAVDPAALESAWMNADHAMAALTRAEMIADDIEQRLVRMFGDDEVRVFGGARSEIRMPLQPRARRQRAALPRRGGSALGDRRAGRGHGDLRVLPEALQVRCDRRGAAVRRWRRAAATPSTELSSFLRLRRFRRILQFVQVTRAAEPAHLREDLIPASSRRAKRACTRRIGFGSTAASVAAS